MARYHTTPSGNIPFTPEEETTRDLEEADFEVVLVERAKTQYQRDRKEEYDQLNQFEMQFDDKENSTTTWVDKINEIKGRHPK